MVRLRAGERVTDRGSSGIASGEKADSELGELEISPYECGRGARKWRTGIASITGVSFAVLRMVASAAWFGHRECMENENGADGHEQPAQPTGRFDFFLAQRGGTT